MTGDNNRESEQEVKADDSNSKSIRKVNKTARERLEEENITVTKKVAVKKTDENGNTTEETQEVTKVYATGSEVFKEFFDNLADEARRKAEKEMEKPRYRFLEKGKAYIICEKQHRGRAVIVNKNTGAPILFDEDVNILSEFSEKASIGDIVDIRYKPNKSTKADGETKKEDNSNDANEESRGIFIKNYEELELVPFFTYDRENVYLKINELEKKIRKLKYRVDIYEDMDCIDVTRNDRYYIRIRKGDGIYIDIDLLKYEEDIKDFTFDEQEFLENKICRIEGSNSTKTRKIAGCIAEYIAHIMYFKELYTLKYSKIGWAYYDEDNSGWIFKYDKIYSKIALLKGEASDNCAEGLDCKNEMADLEQTRIDTDNLKRDAPKENPVKDGEKLTEEQKNDLINQQYGNEFEWVIFTRKLINQHPYDALLLGAGISGIIRQLLPYTKETNININIVGAPGSGKSTLSHYLLSIFGNPTKLEGSFIDTANSMEQTRIKRPVLPYVLDERMLRIEGASEKEKAHTILMDIFREYEGKVKERMGKQYEESSGERTYGPVISSSVKSMMDYVFEADDIGQYRRFMEFDIGSPNSRVLFDGKEEAGKAESLAYNNYGYGIRIIIDYLLEVLQNSDKDATVICERFSALNDNIKEKLLERENKEKDKKVRSLASTSERFALIVLSYQILRESLNYYDKRMFEGLENGANQDLYDRIAKVDAVDHTEKIIDLLIDNLVLKLKKTKQKADFKVDNKLYTYILNNKEYFYDKSQSKYSKDAGKIVFENKDKYLGFVEIKDNEIELTTLMLYQLDQFWYMDEIPQPEKILKYIKEVDEQGIGTNEEAVAYGEKEYNSYVNYAQKNFKDTKGGILGRTNYPIGPGKKTVDFHKKNIKYINLADKEKGKGES